MHLHHYDFVCFADRLLVRLPATAASCSRLSGVGAPSSILVPQDKINIAVNSYAYIYIWIYIYTYEYIYIYIYVCIYRHIDLHAEHKKAERKSRDSDRTSEDMEIHLCKCTKTASSVSAGDDRTTQIHLALLLLNRWLCTIFKQIGLTCFDGFRGFTNWLLLLCLACAHLATT